MKAYVLFAVGLTVSASLGEDINFTNQIATITNLEGHVYRDVKLVRGNADGIIYQEGAGLGLISYTNLAPSILQSFGIPTNRISLAKARAEKKAGATAVERQQAQEVAQQAANLKALAKKLITLETTIMGRVIQVTSDGLLVDITPAGPETVLVILSDYPVSKFDGDFVNVGLAARYGISDSAIKRAGVEPQSLKAYHIGSYKYISTTGAEKTIRRYTCDAAKAISYLQQGGNRPETP